MVIANNRKLSEDTVERFLEVECNNNTKHNKTIGICTLTAENALKTIVKQYTVYRQKAVIKLLSL